VAMPARDTPFRSQAALAESTACKRNMRHGRGNALNQ
jgi:hypothetical protein